MKKGVYLLVGFIAGLVIAPVTIFQQAMAQVPSGVAADSIAPVIAAAAWRSESPFRSHHIVADPKTGQMVFIEGKNVASNGASLDPSWYYSTDNGTTWSGNTSPFADNTNAGAVAVAADSSFDVFVAFNRGDSLYFNEDAIAHDGTTLSTDVLVNAPGTMAQCPDIAVSPDGKHIIVTAQPTHGDYDTLYAYVSSDGGSTWTQNLALATLDPSIAPPGLAKGTTPNFQWDVTSLSMGTNGYAFVAVHCDYDTAFSNDHWNLISETTDYGATWTPSWVTPPTYNKGDGPTGNAWDYNGSVLAVGSTPHLASLVIDNNGVQILIESHKEGGVWVHHVITHPDSLGSLSYETPRDGGLSVDTQGRLYCAWTDQNLSVPNTTYEIFMSGSSDGGDTWTQPIRLTDTQPFCSGNEVLNSPQLPQLLPTTAAVMAINGEIFSLFPGQNPPTAWVEAQFPLTAIWNGPFDKDTVQRVLQAHGYKETFGSTGFNWVDITTVGTRVDSSLHDVPSGSYDPDDGNTGLYAIGFPFVLYNTAYDSMEISANGFMSFTDSTFGWPPPFPVNTYKTIIAPFGSDANHDIHGPQLYHWTNPAKDTCVIEWYHETSYDTPTDTALTYEIILAKGDSSITFQYQDVGPTPQDMHVVVQGGTGLGFDYHRLGLVPAAGMMAKCGPSVPTGVKEGSPTTPLTYALSQNYPNPFNPTTQINYSVPKNGFVTLKVYNVLGQEITTLFSGNQKAGNYIATFDATKYASGVYFYRIQAGSFSSVKKMVLMK